MKCMALTKENVYLDLGSDRVNPPQEPITGILPSPNIKTPFYFTFVITRFFRKLRVLFQLINHKRIKRRLRFKSVLHPCFNFGCLRHTTSHNLGKRYRKIWKSVTGRFGKALQTRLQIALHVKIWESVSSKLKKRYKKWIIGKSLTKSKSIT